MKIGQVTFWKLTGKKLNTYNTGKYNKHDRPYVSMFYEGGLNDSIGKQN